MWVLEAEHDKKGYAGIHKDGSLGFEYVAPQARRQGVASRMQAFLTNHMIENDLIPYGMVLVGNDVAKHLQIKFGSQFAEKIFIFMQREFMNTNNAFCPEKDCKLQGGVL